MTSRKKSIPSAPQIKTHRRFGVFTLIFFFISICLMMMFDVVKIPYLNKWRKRDDLKYILFWNKYYDYPYYGLADHDGQDIFVDMNCSVNTCYITETKTLMSVDEFDAVIFHVYHLKHPSTVWLWGKEPLPAIRSAHQRYVYLVFESPIYSGSDLTAWGDIFNWTWTYRLDSDIPSPYGRVLPINSSDFYSAFSPPQSWLTPENQVDDYYDIVKKKSRLVAWLVSHCDTQSKREEYVKLLSADIAIDQFGDCSSEHWPKGDLKGFYNMLNEKYKFYISFENSLCKDYVTEKFFNILKYNVVPIVYGDAQYETIAPPMSYISALDYKSPKELANYIKYLDENPKEYAKYFWWKKHYKISKVKVPQPQSLCKLCELLHSNSPAKTYNNLNKWWTGENDGSSTSICREPSFNP